jgi:hypothetical protein
LRRLALLALALAPLAGAQDPLGQGNLAAILSALGIREQPPGLTTVRLWLDGNGGYVDLPPRSATSALCVTERHSFEGNTSIGFRRFDAGPSYVYWQPISAAGCAATTLADISSKQTGVRAGIAPDEITAILDRTAELIELTWNGPKCEELPRLFTLMEGDPYIAGLQLSERFVDRDGRPAYEATLTSPGKHGGPNVAFSLVDDELELHLVCPVFWSPFPLADQVWTFPSP